jgi:hypothetical protein
MSQRECAGFNWPELSIAASDPVSISPEAVKRTGPANFTACSSIAACFLPSAVIPVGSIFSIETDRPPLGVHGLGQPAIAAWALRSRFPDGPLWPFDPFGPSLAWGVAHDERVASTLRSLPLGCAICFSNTSGVQLELLKSRVLGDAHEVKPLPDVRRTDAARSKNRLPNGVIERLQVSLNKVEPAVSNR